MPKQVHWEGLPEEVRQAVQEQAGAVVKTEPISEGINSEITAIVHTRSARVFVKGARVSQERRIRSLRREAAINPYVTAVSPDLVCQIETAGWLLLGFEYIEGRRIDYSPGSPDLPLIVETLAALAEIPCPDLPMPTLESRMTNYTPADELWRFTGNALLHTDLNPGNVRIRDRRAYLVDWACPTRGVGWSDAADLALCLITCGHTPRDAENLVAGIPTWEHADPEAIHVSVMSTEATWTGLYDTASDDTWINSTVEAAQRWAIYRRRTG